MQELRNITREQINLQIHRIARCEVLKYSVANRVRDEINRGIDMRVVRPDAVAGQAGAVKCDGTFVRDEALPLFVRFDDEFERFANRFKRVYQRHIIHVPADQMPTESVGQPHGFF